MTSVTVGSIEDIPFPDLSVGVNTKIGVWRAIAHYLEEADQGDGITALYKSFPALANKLHQHIHSKMDLGLRN